MNTPEKPDYGEPWHYIGKTIWTQIGIEACDSHELQLKKRIIACVNAMAGRPDPAAAMARLAQLEWVPITERLPSLDDANKYQDVEWSDGRDIWQGNYRKEDDATHWRSITLP
jgi:hypothetical protein